MEVPEPVAEQRAPADLAERLAFAVATAEAAGREVLQRYGAKSHQLKAAGSPVTDADLAANRLIVAAIRDAYPGEAVLAEESRDDRSRLDQELVWVVDPLDGTKEYLAGNGEFSIMIGLAWRGASVLGVVHAPVWGETLAAHHGGGAHLYRGGAAERLVPGAAPTPPRMVGSRSHAEGLVARLAAALGVVDSTVSGSVGLKCALIAKGERDLYVHPAPYLCEWDTCAPEVIAREAGGVVTDCRGRPLRYNKADPLQPHGIAVFGRGTESAQVTVAALYDQQQSSSRTAAAVEREERRDDG